MTKVLLLHGPNLNLLGQREKNHYGAETLASINNRLMDLANTLDLELSIYQSNHEGELITAIQQSAEDKIDFMIFNPAGYTHTSIALRDAMLAVMIPFIEVHLSNIHQRESFRHHSYFSDIAKGVITGLGAEGYVLALRYIHAHLNSKR